MQTQVHTKTSRASMSSLDDDALLTSAQVKAHCGNVSDMCIWRWLRNERVGFPQPIKINGRNYWKLGDLRAWQGKHETKVAA